jgi:protein phosphatase
MSEEPPSASPGITAGATASRLPSGVSLHWTALTDKGRIRKNNEDAFLAVAFDGREINYLGKQGQATLENQDLLFAVSDGMGGANAGEFASKIAVERLAHLMPRAFRTAAAGVSTGFGDVLQELFESIHEAMRRMSFGYEECRGMGATLTLTWLTPEWLYFGHLGDSRLYYLPAEGGIKQLSQDHTLPGRLLRAGEISEREARNHPQRNILEQVLGAQRKPLEVQLGAVNLQPGDRFVICSDGLTDGVTHRGIDDQIRRPTGYRTQQDPAKRLIDEGLHHSGRDNITVIVLEVRAENGTADA